jgi:hypothetical protein
MITALTVVEKVMLYVCLLDLTQVITAQSQDLLEKPIVILPLM